MFFVLLGMLLVPVAAYAATSAAATLSAKPAIKMRDGATRLVVTITSKRQFTARTLPRGVKVVAGAKTYVLRRSGAGMARIVWRTRELRGAKGTALQGLAGEQVAIEVRTLAGTTTLRRLVPPHGAAPSTGERALAVARRYLGTPFVWGGADPAIGFDSPGLAQYSYGRVGIELPRLTHTQFQVGVPVNRDALVPGDLVFFRDPTGYVHHVGIFAGHAQFIHAPHTGDVVKFSSLDEPYYHHQFAGGRHIAD